MKRKAIIVGSVGIVLIAVIVGLFVTGRVALVGKQTYQEVALRSSVCDDDLVGQYNQAVIGEVDDAYAGNIRKVIQVVEGRDGQVEDPNCAFMRVRYYTLTKDVSKAKAALADLKTASDNGLYIGPKMMAPASLEQLEAQVRALEQGTEGDDDAEVIG